MPKNKKLPHSIQQSAIGNSNIQVAGDHNAVHQEVTNYIPMENELDGINHNESQTITDATTSQNTVGNDNIQVIGNNNVIQKIINFFRLDTAQQRALKNRRAMLEMVGNIWVKGVLERSLYHELLIQLGMEERPDAVVHPWDIQVRMPDRPNRLLPTGMSIMQVFDEMNETMLILGEPGSGKTTMLLELTRDCILRALHDHTRPIPVIFNLSSWPDPGKSIDDWLVNELRTKYSVSEKIARQWVSSDELQLLLDGLDEVVQEDRDACVRSINAFRQSHAPGTSIVVCSRSNDYDALTAKLNLNGAVLLQPLTPEQIEAYFTSSGPELAAVHEILLADTTLQEMVRQPLLLTIMILAYQGHQPVVSEIEKTIPLTTRRKQLFDTYLERMFTPTARAPKTRFAQSDVLQWLSWLAYKMSLHNPVPLLIENIQPSWLANTRLKILYSLISILLIGLLFGVFTGLLGGLFNGGLVVGLTAGLILGPFGGLMLGLILPGSDEIQTVDLLTWNKKLGLMAGLIFGLAFGLMFGVIGSFVVRPTFGIVYGLVIGLLTGLLGGLLFGLHPNQVELIIHPGEKLSLSAKNFLIIWLTSGLIVGLLCWLLGGPLFGLLFGFFGGLFGGLRFGGSSLMKHYALLFVLSRNNLLPRKLIAFLDHCVDLIFLRRVGGGYIFVHRLLMEHFADMYPADEK